MYSIQRPNNRVKPVFSNQSLLKKDVSSSRSFLKENRTLTSSVDVNPEALLALNQHLQSISKKQITPIKPKHVAKYQSDHNLKKMPESKNNQRQSSNSLLDKFHHFQNDNNHDLFQNLFDQQYIPTKRSNNASDLQGVVVVPNLYNFLEGDAIQKSKQTLQRSRQTELIKRQQTENTSRSQHSQEPRQQMSRRPVDIKPLENKKSESKSMNLPLQMSNNLQQNNTQQNNNQQNNTQQNINQQNNTQQNNNQQNNNQQNNIQQNNIQQNNNQQNNNQQNNIQQRSCKKLNFNIPHPPPNEMDDQFLYQQNKISDLLIEHVLNKDDYYDKIKHENQELKEAQVHSQQKFIDLQKSLKMVEQRCQDGERSIENERSKYQSELYKLQEKLNIVKTLHSQQEKIKVEELTKQLTKSNEEVDYFKQMVGQFTLQSITFLQDFQQQVIECDQSHQSAVITASQLLKHSLHIIFKTINSTQNLKLQVLDKCRIPEDINFEEFFQKIERIQETIPNETLEDSIDQSSELSFRQKEQSLDASIPLSLVHNKGSVQSKNVSLQEQFNTFLELQEEDLKPQMGSPYFTAHPISHTPEVVETKRQIDMPLQMQQKRFQTELSETNARNLSGQNISIVQVQDTSENEKTLYDSLFLEFSKNEEKNKHAKKKTAALHNLKYLDQQISRSNEADSKQTKKVFSTAADKENVQVNRGREEDPKVWGVAKFNYTAQKENDLTFSKGDQIEIQKQTKNGWWIGALNGKIGYFPYNFVHIEEEKRENK